LSRKPVDKKLYRNYLQKAEEMLDIAQYAASRSKNNAAVATSVHCAINAIDALGVFYLGRRHSGGHEEALNTVRGALSEAELKEVTKQFSSLIALKNEAEYQPDLMKEAQAQDAVTRASRILSKVRKKLPG
jgi:HEPN domain-containing protein